MFSVFSRRAYLDHASATNVTRLAERAFMKSLAAFANPNATHKDATIARSILDAAREMIARCVQTKEHTITFTSSTTESNSLAIIGIVESHLQEGKHPADLHALYIDGSHSSIVEPMQYLKQRGVVVECVSFEKDVPLLTTLDKHVHESTVLVSLERVNSETGYLFDTKSISRLVHQKSKQAVVHVDASGSPLFEQISWTRLGADLLTFDAQKIGGVRGIGVLVKNTLQKITPRTFGGGQEWGLRPGTQSPALAFAFATALQEAQKSVKEFESKTHALRAYTLKELMSLKPEVLCNEGKENAPHILNVSLLEIDTEYLSYLLDARGVSVSTKSACDEGTTVSKAVRAQTGDESRARNTLRISFGAQSTRSEVKKFIQALKDSLAIIDKTNK